jgi:NADPH:quinone reductase-like Zn-dependent oxidoreductase
MTDCYYAEEWPQQLGKLLGESRKPYLDSVIDSGGGDILGQTGALLKHGGKLVCYGM